MKKQTLQYKCAEVPQSYISMLPFSVTLSFSKISQPQGQDQKNCKQT